MISIILSTHNTFPYTKLAYESIRKYNPTIEIVMLEDASNDETSTWLKSLNDENVIKWFNPNTELLGHTITYNIGAKLATKEYICIFHSDMICSPNFIKNLEKHLKPKTIVSGTRIEPPIYSADDAKVIQNFGIYHNEWNETAFLEFVKQKESEYKNRVTQGFFAPWAMNRKEYIDIQGMDKLFKPFPVEDSDFINRLVLAGYKVIQSRDSFCYHWVSRGHRWNGQIKVDTEEFYQRQYNAFHNFIRKWGGGPIMNSFSYPIINKKYDIGLVIDFKDINFSVESNVKFVLDTLIGIEPFCSSLYTNLPDKIVEQFLKIIQPKTQFNLKNKFKNITDAKTNDILVEFNYVLFTGGYSNSYQLQKGYKFLFTLPEFLSNSYESDDSGECEFDIYKITINKLTRYENQLIYPKDPYYQNQLISLPDNDPALQGDL